MDSQYGFVNNRRRSIIVIRGQDYVREGFNIKVSTADQFDKKCDLLGEDKSKVVERLVEAFVHCNGWGREVKSAEFERRAGSHIKDAVESVHEGMFPWMPSTN